MTSFKVGGGQLLITDEIIQINLGPIRALRRLYEQSKLIMVFFTVGLSYTAGTAVFGSSLLCELGTFVIIFTIIGITLATIYPRIRNNIRTASEISRSTVDHVEYTTGSRFRLPVLRIIVSDNNTTGVRPITLYPYQYGGKEQLEAGIQTFEDAGIEIVPADETDNKDS
ncbi:hypothetical protein [Halocatena salina]|uniref:Uncharacterized protein n=1 Tax=Halocatena salina TaxID=2934340 RepID=A0A8U0A6S4_9EURY|nr:hypothetical protein [Halocatena salina]UPM44880.1 hypothetical protein MW046_15985 [Halocatena salina]